MADSQSRIDELRRQIEQLEALRAVLGDETTDDKKVELEAQLRAELEAARQGGVSIHDISGGEVSVAGDIVGRDKILAALGDRSVIVGGDAQGLLVVTGDGNTITLAPEKVSPDKLLQAYYRALAGECRRLPLGVVDPKFAQPGQAGEVSLAQVYTDLEVVSPPRAEEEADRAWGLRLARGEGDERTALLEALAEPQAGKVTLLGDPGSGKTTFVNYLTTVLADATAAAGEAAPPLPDALQGQLPVRLVLRAVASHIPAAAEAGTAAMLWDALQADVAERLGAAAAARLLPHLQARLLAQGGLILLDGLDEVPAAGDRRRNLLQAIKNLVDGLPESARIVLTARPYAYADPRWQLPDFQILALAPFNREQVNRFVAQWHRAVRPAMGWDAVTAQERERGLARALQERAYLADLASRPLLLTLMATLHTSWGQLPDDQADLYEESVKLLLSRWQRGRQVQGADGQALLEPGVARALGVGEDLIRAALEQLAYQTHARQGEEATREDVPADIPVGAVLAVFTPLLPDDFNPRVLLDYLDTRAGLLVGRREEVYAFPHRSFQEYLAACHLANTEPEFAAKLRELVWVDAAWWREVFLLGVGKMRQGGLGNV